MKKQNKTKQTNKTKKQNKTKQNKTKENENENENKQNKTKRKHEKKKKNGVNNKEVLYKYHSVIITAEGYSTRYHLKGTSGFS